MDSGYTSCACRDCMEIAISNDVSAPDKWNRILNGERVVCSSGDMDRFPFHDCLASVSNPNRVGILDEWIAYLKIPSTREPELNPSES